VLSLDLGTGSARAVVFDGAGIQVAVAQREWHHPAVDGAPGGRSFDTSANWALICACIREVILALPGGAGAIACVTAVSMREGMVLYDASGVEMWACPNIDGRADVEADELARTGEARTLFEAGGDWVSITSPARFRWIARHQPELLARTSTMAMLSDWAIQRMAGVVVTDPSCGSSSNLFDLAARTWSRRSIELVGLSPSIFPEVVESGTIVGSVTAEAAAATGLLAGTPVAVGGADTQLGLVGMGPLAADEVALIGGSFWQVALTTDVPLIDPEARLRTLCHALPGLWMTEGIGFYSGLAMRWLRDAFCETEVALARARGVDPYMVMEEAAGRVPVGSGGVVATFSNVMDAKRWVQASPSFLGFDVDSPGVGRTACIRAVEEQAAYVALRHLRILEDLRGRRFQRIVFGGGAAKGPLWARIVADVLGVEVVIPAVKEASALGAAMTAGAGVGLYGSLADVARTAVRQETCLTPDPDAYEAYRIHSERWAEVYRRVLGLAEDRLLPPMYWPAGALPAT
jgi:autoinducer 2 (AI-2) kinase